MNTKRMKSIKDLKDSQLLYEKTLPTFGYIILIAILCLLIAVAIWSLHTSKVYMVKSSGNVQSTNKNFVMSPYTGELVSIDLAEGDKVEEGDVLFSVKSVDLDLQDEQLEGQRQTYERQIAGNNKLVQSIQEDTNLFDINDPDDNLYYSQYEMYKSQIEQQKLDTTAMKAYGYTEEQIQGEAEKNQGKISELYYATIKTAEDQILQAQNQLDAINAQLGAIDSGKTNYTIVANTSGIVHMLGEYKSGMVVQAASAIASIGTDRDAVEIISYVAASDATLVEIGDDVDVAVAGLTQAVYGVIGGKVTQIDSDITMPQSESSEGAQPYFKVKIEPKENYLVSKHGHMVNLSNGMSVETRISYDKVTYFDYVLESLGLLVRG
ncbi:MAG: HlyD family secretion protein [Clostridiales Family XIII bacterium]|jgi:multidrug efflux pump subunit AcrA (membrane-fusion protein)|nr:HlyD family secretion protein [Clostridiales Family XIII bacterium]